MSMIRGAIYEHVALVIPMATVRTRFCYILLSRASASFIFADAEADWYLLEIGNGEDTGLLICKAINI